MTKLERFLSLLPKSELPKVAEFLAAPFFNKNKNIEKLFEWYLSRDEKHPSILSVEAFKAIFPGKEYEREKRRLVKLSHKLYTLLIRYMRQKEVTGKDFFSSLSLLQFYSNKGLEKDFEAQLNTINKNLEQIPYKDSSFLFKELLVHQELTRLESTRIDNGVDDVNYEKYSNALDNYYLKSKLVIVCQMLNRQQVTTTRYNNLQKQEQLLKIIAQARDTTDFQIDIWLLALELLTCKNEEKHISYFILKEKVFENHHELKISETRNLCGYLQNNASRIFDDKHSLYEELLSLYKLQIDNNILFSSDRYLLTPILPINIVKVALGLKDIAWAEKEFLVKHKEYIAGETASLCMGLIEFEKGNYDKVLDLIIGKKFSNIFLNILSRVLRLKVFFELQDKRRFSAFHNSHHVYIHRCKDKINDIHIIANRNFLKIINKTFKLTIDKNFKEITASQVIDEINGYTNIIEREWLTSKAQQLNTV